MLLGDAVNFLELFWGSRCTEVQNCGSPPATILHFNSIYTRHVSRVIQRPVVTEGREKRERNQITAESTTRGFGTSVMNCASQISELINLICLAEVTSLLNVPASAKFEMIKALHFTVCKKLIAAHWATDKTLYHLLFIGFTFLPTLMHTIGLTWRGLMDKMFIQFD